MDLTLTRILLHDFSGHAENQRALSIVHVGFSDHDFLPVADVDIGADSGGFELRLPFLDPHTGGHSNLQVQVLQINDLRRAVLHGKSLRKTSCAASCASSNRPSSR